MKSPSGRYIWSREAATFVPIEQIKRKAPPRGPAIISDIRGYRSPADGSWVSSRSQHRQHLRDHGLIEVGNEQPTPPSRPAMPSPGPDIRHAIEELSSK